MNVAERIELQIKNGTLPKPIPRWLVVAKRCCLWGGLGLTVAASAASTAVTWWLVADPNGLLGVMHSSDWFRGALNLLPITWIFISLGSAVAAYLIFVHTPYGYRYSRALVAGSLGFGLMSFGGALYASDLAESIETSASALPGYHKVAGIQPQVFMKPERGMIVGHVESEDDRVWQVLDPSGTVWWVTVPTTSQMPFIKRAQGTSFVGSCVRITGTLETSTRSVTASVIKTCPRAVHLDDHIIHANVRMKDEAK